jgi:hypothetical protein
MLGIPLPDWATRKPSGPKPGKAIMAAFRADNPETFYEATMRKVAEHTSRLPANHHAGQGPSLAARIAALKDRERSSGHYHEDVDPLTLP